MIWKEYSIEILTPCISAGADQLKAEIRIPSIRGQVRWWFRALGGTRNEEKTLFGGVHGEAERSKVTFRLKEPLTSSQAANLHDLVGKDPNQPRAYLLWPLRPTRDNPQKRGILTPGSKFALLYSIDDRLKDHTLTRKLTAAIEAWILLGSLGTRSRRGYGSIGFGADTIVEGIPSPDVLRQRITGALSVFGRPQIKAMLLCGPRETENDALDYLGQWLRSYRAGSKKSVPNPGKWGKNDHDVARAENGKLFRPVIGLPLTQRYSDGTVLETEYEGADRWASPVHLKVVKCGGKFYPLATFFTQMTLPDGARVRLSNRRGRQQVTLPVDHGLLKQMMMPGPDAYVLCEG